MIDLENSRQVIDLMSGSRADLRSNDVGFKSDEGSPSTWLNPTNVVSNKLSKSEILSLYKKHLKLTFIISCGFLMMMMQLYIPNNSNRLKYNKYPWSLLPSDLSEKYVCMLLQPFGQSALLMSAARATVSNLKIGHSTIVGLCSVRFL